MGKVIDLTGRRFGQRVVLARAFPDTQDGRTWWLTVCDCGRTKALRADALGRKDGRHHHCRSCAPRGPRPPRGPRGPYSSEVPDEIIVEALAAGLPVAGRPLRADRREAARVLVRSRAFRYGQLDAGTIARRVGVHKRTVERVVAAERQAPR